MTKLDVLNVGQGDSMVLTPDEGCKYNNDQILIDLGPGGVDITKDIDEDKNVKIFITHHDHDHLGGLRFFYNEKFEKINEIIVPFYQEEITLIAQAILRMPGIKKATECDEYVKALQELVDNQVYIKKLVEGAKNCPKLSFAYEGSKFCNHIECLNPPQIIETYDWLNEVAEEDLKAIVNEIFEADFVEELNIYISNKGRRYSLEDSQIIRSILFSNQRVQEIDIDQTNKANFVLDFILQNVELFNNFNSKPTRKKMSMIHKAFVKYTHDICIVLKVEYDDNTLLLTGDASKKVFNRLIKQKTDISAKYLKVPHHGSKKNLSEKILDEIKPQVAIISHNNGLFGKANDPHPNNEVIDMLKKKKVEILITNDVKKYVGTKQVTKMKKSNHSNDKNGFVVIH